MIKVVEVLGGFQAVCEQTIDIPVDHPWWKRRPKTCYCGGGLIEGKIREGGICSDSTREVDEVLACDSCGTALLFEGLEMWLERRLAMAVREVLKLGGTVEEKTGG